MAGIKKVASVGASIVEGVPLIGPLIVNHIEDAIDYVSDWTNGKKIENIFTIINEIIRAKFPMEDDISIGVARLTLVMSSNPEKIAALKNAYQAEANPKKKGMFASMYSWMSDKSDQLVAKQWPGLEERRDAIARSQAVEDVTLLFTYLIVDFKAILAEKTLTFEQQIEQMLSEKKLDVLFAKMGMAGACSCGGKWIPREGNKPDQCRSCSDKKSKGGVKCEKCGTKICMPCYDKIKKP